jgi:hypothetical protein
MTSDCWAVSANYPVSNPNDRDTHTLVKLMKIMKLTKPIKLMTIISS